MALDWYGHFCSWLCSPSCSTWQKRAETEPNEVMDVQGKPEFAEILEIESCSKERLVETLMVPSEQVALLPALGNSYLFQATLPALLPFAGFLRLRVACKQYSQNWAFEELLRVDRPKKMLHVAADECVSVFDLAERFPSPEKRKALKLAEQEKQRALFLAGEPNTYLHPPTPRPIKVHSDSRYKPKNNRRGSTGFCCPPDRVRYTSKSIAGNIIKGNGFLYQYDESFKTLKRERFYQTRLRDGHWVPKWIQSFLWGLGNVELCCLRECGEDATDSSMHRLVDSNWCMPSTYDDDEFVVPHCYD